MQRTHPQLEEVAKLAVTVSEFVHNMKVKCAPPEVTSVPQQPSAPPASPPDTPVVACARPGCSAASDAVRLLQCCGCRKVSYCSCDCQKLHWREHKAACFAVRHARTWTLK
jgi:hypothetical protein